MVLEVVLWVFLGVHVVELEVGHHAHCQLALFALICCRLPPLSLLFASDDTLRLCLLAADPAMARSQGSDAQSAVRVEADAVDAAVVVFFEQLDGKLHTELFVIKLPACVVIMVIYTWTREFGTHLLLVRSPCTGCRRSRHPLPADGRMPGATTSPSCDRNQSTTITDLIYLLPPCTCYTPRPCVAC